MISGEWGTGKTFLVKSHFQQHTDYLYVSLNGTTSAHDIVERLYLAAFPVLADKTIKALGSIARSIAGAFRLKSDLDMQSLLDLDKYRILIFDDLERSLMSPEELLGFINSFVEHDTKHVILIANEHELYKKPTYKNIREKVVGFSLDVKPDFDAALMDFRSNFPEPYKKFLESAHGDLLNALNETGLKNVRVTKYVLNEFLEVFEQISNAKIGTDDALAMFLAFFVLDYSYKTGTVTRDDIKGRQTDDFTLALLRHREGYEPGAMERLSEAHANIDVFSKSFDNEYLELKICAGFHDSDKLARTLGDISGKTNSTQNPEWRNLWYLIHQSDDVVEESFARMMSNFNSRSYDDAGVILHVFGLLHRMREAGLLKWPVERITRECKKFILDKFNSQSLPLFGGDFITGYRHGSAHGLGFTAIRETGFQEAADYYRNKSDELKNVLLLTELNSIIEKSEFDLNAFRAIILQGVREDNVYSRPFLHDISANKFAAAVMKESAKQQFEILSALGSRYYQSPYPNVRSLEAPWLRKLVTALRKIARKQSSVTKFRIEETIKWNLSEPVIPETDEQPEIDG